jgi:N4-gp56 family major capsid protein
MPPPAPVTDIITANTAGSFQLPHALRTIYSAELEYTSQPMLVYDQFSEVKTDFRVQKGQQAYWTIFQHLPPAIQPLVANQDVEGESIQDFQVSLTVDEYGDAIGTVEELDLTSYFGPISDIVRSVLAPQTALTLDTLCRNAMIGAGATYRLYGGTASSRAVLGAGDVMTPDLVRLAAYQLSVRRNPLMGAGYVAIAHPATIYDLRGSTYWIEAQKYAGATAIFNGEEGTLHGVRFVKSDRARIENGGAIVAQTALSAPAVAGDQTITVAATTGFAVGQEVSILSSTTAGDVNLPNDPKSEPCVITNIAGNVLTLQTRLLLSHAVNSRVVEARDVYVVSFFGSQKSVGKGIVLAPEVRVALPVDRLQRMHFVGWYSLLGYGVLRPWALINLEVAGSVASTPAFPY